jgi:tubulin-specific chaperone E
VTDSHAHSAGKSKSPTAASFVRPSRPSDAPQTFVSALQLKYASEAATDDGARPAEKQIIISGKLAQEVGFDKIRKKQAQLSELKIVILDNALIAYASESGHTNEGHDGIRPIRETCPKVTELDLSRNLFTHLSTVVDMCAELEHLGILRLKCVINPTVSSFKCGSYA